jgi:hypothetical protein
MLPDLGSNLGGCVGKLVANYLNYVMAKAIHSSETS